MGSDRRKIFTVSLFVGNNYFALNFVSPPLLAHGLNYMNKPSHAINIWCVLVGEKKKKIFCIYGLKRFIFKN